jgi:hypothetical protein
MTVAAGPDNVDNSEILLSAEHIAAHAATNGMTFAQERWESYGGRLRHVVESDA